MIFFIFTNIAFINIPVFSQIGVDLEKDERMRYGP